jgi:D-serine dehydratase
MTLHSTNHGLLTTDPRKSFVPGVSPRDTVGRPMLEAGLMMPLLVVRSKALDANIATMARYCERNNVSLAPHGKSTMAPTIIRKQVVAGAWAVTAATVWQAVVLREMGLRRVLLANEVTDESSISALASTLVMDPEFEVIVYVDSLQGVALLDRMLYSGGVARPLPVLVEVGLIRGRAGCRDLAAVDRVADAVAASHALELVGASGYEGIVDPRSETGLPAVDGYLEFLGEVATHLVTRGSINPDREPIVSAGGSIYFDRVVGILGPLVEGLGGRLVLRSGCYVTHDDGLYERFSPFGSASLGSDRFEPALELWATVISTPEPGLAIAGFGRRDAPEDHGLPVVKAVIHDGMSRIPAPAIEVFELNDQHAFLRVPEGIELSPGDVLTCGISHPCTAFDKWRSIPVVDEDGVIREVLETYF